ncbi:hypothetical protein CCACVL1_30166 [Corchorus capsularis]|uniref:Uncharacterized protein n=1 Tax=Corchorus capsularis TaxID=210143 RepID=A0A1R3FYI2_COCAP|nr:hypothetical protein CCACVL1_30166 [Corchorus capsularis]
MGRAPCCDKANVKKGPWSPEEDAKLKAYIEQHGTGGNWIALPQKIGLKRCGKSCRLRWLNYLRPNIKHGGFSEEEDKIICSLYISIGSRWSIIAAQLPGRTDNDIKNYWNTRLKKKLLGKQRKEQQSRRGNNNTLKQEMINRGNNNGDSNSSLIFPHHSSNQISSYWPELPAMAAAAVAPIAIPYSDDHEEQRNIIDSQASMRRLLIKLGGRFSDDDHQHHVVNDDGMSTIIHHQTFPNDPSILSLSPSQQQLYEQTATAHLPSSSSSSPMEALNNNMGTTHDHQFVNSQYIDGANLHMLRAGQGIDIQQEMGYSSSNPQRVDGMEFLYGEEMVNSIRALSSCETINGSWATDHSIQVCPTVASEYGVSIQQAGIHQQQEYGFSELRYPGA